MPHQTIQYPIKFTLELESQERGAAVLTALDGFLKKFLTMAEWTSLGTQLSRTAQAGGAAKAG